MGLEFGIVLPDVDMPNPRHSGQTHAIYCSHNPRIYNICDIMHKDLNTYRSKGNEGSEVKQKRTKLNLTSVVLVLYSKGLYAKQIADRLKISKARVSQITKTLEKSGYLHMKLRGSFKYYELTEKGKTAIQKRQVKFFSSGARTKLHAMQGSLKIIHEDRLPGNFWQAQNRELKNWIPKYKRLPNPIGLTITKTPSKIIFHVFARELDDPAEANNIAWRSALFLTEYFKKKGILLDIWSARITNQHYSIPDKVAKLMTEKGVYVEVNLGRNCVPILTADKPREARAWIDSSEGRPEIETNDIEFATRYIRMPEMVATMLELQRQQAEQMELYAKHLNAHIPVLKGMEKLLKKLNNRLSQTTIRGFV